MESRAEKATELHERGFNCAQAVACAYADVVGVDERTIFRACEGLGAGMGGMEGTCGALSGACVLAGLAGSDGDVEHPASKGATYAVSRGLVSRFAAAAGATRCRDLKGLDDGVVLMPCPACVRLGADVFAEVMTELGR